MAKKMMAESCPTSECCTWFAWVLLLLGVALLARDMMWFNVLGNASWPALLITLVGLKKVCKSW